MNHCSGAGKFFGQMSGKVIHRGATHMVIRAPGKVSRMPCVKMACGEKPLASLCDDSANAPPINFVKEVLDKLAVTEILVAN